MGSFIVGIIFTLVSLFAAGIYFVSTGNVDVAASNAHHPMVYQTLAKMREKSIEKQLVGIQVPTDIMSGTRIKRGAGKYDQFCASCHLTPLEPNTDVRKGLYPMPPDLYKPPKPSYSPQEIARIFWITKHGIKATGMPSWQKAGMDDETIWDVVAFVLKLPSLHEVNYGQIVAASKGLPHGLLQEFQPQQPATEIPAAADSHSIQP